MSKEPDRRVSGRREGGRWGWQDQVRPGAQAQAERGTLSPRPPRDQHHSKQVGWVPGSLGMALGDKGKVKLSPVPTNQFLPGALFLEQQSLNQHQPHLGACQTCRLSGLVLLNQSAL